ncbi:MAG: T9SS C-terminal target domain-containing protein [Bacteroidetes bacterium]|nr:MAG: T9SS C-terminal target domain-containing protein [Bacteroidota bacterium]TAF93848.1 MAG: T9SS C-terminal target domain-containing protein [Bacteroidota bacterium]
MLGILYSSKKRLLLLLMVASTTLCMGFIPANTPNSPTPTVSSVNIVSKFYPNPAVSFIQFEFTSDVTSAKYTLEVYSFMGKRMLQTPMNGRAMTVNFSDEFYRGMYVFHVRSANGQIVETGKFQVVR